MVKLVKLLICTLIFRNDSNHTDVTDFPSKDVSQFNGLPPMSVTCQWVETDTMKAVAVW